MFISIAAASHITYVDFTLLGTAYTFTVSKWSGKGLTPFLQRFHDYCPRNLQHFGSVATNAEGQAIPSMDRQQKWNCIVQVSHH